MQYTQEAFEILDGIADDALSLAFAAECVAPSYIEQCLRTVLQFHPYADRVKVAETSMTLTHGGVAVSYEIMPRNDEDDAIRRTQRERELREADYDLAHHTLHEVAKTATRLLAYEFSDSIEDCANEAIRKHKFADRLSVFDTDVLKYSHDGIEIDYELTAFDDQP